MKLANELENLPEEMLYLELDKIWNAMKKCVEKGLATEGILPGGLEYKKACQTTDTKASKKTKKMLAQVTGFALMLWL